MTHPSSYCMLLFFLDISLEGEVAVGRVIIGNNIPLYTKQGSYLLRQDAYTAVTNNKQVIIRYSPNAPG